MTSPVPLGPQIAVHLRKDASILALRGTPSGPQWNAITLEQLKSVLSARGEKGASIIYSRDDPDGVLSQEAQAIFQLIMGYRLPIQLRATPPVPTPPYDVRTSEPNKAPEPTTTAVTIRAPSSTARASRGRGSS
jgi:hypothetical protein